MKELPNLKNQAEYSYLKDVPATILQQSLKDLDVAWKNRFAKRAGKPTFKSRYRTNSFRIPQTTQFKIFKLNDKYSGLRLPKMDTTLKVRLDRKLPSKPTSVTIIREADGKYYASFVVVAKPRNRVKTNKTCGTDVGLKTMITIVASDEAVEQKDALKPFKKSQKKLSRLNKKLSRQFEAAKKDGRIVYDKRTKHYAGTENLKNYQKTKQAKAKVSAKIRHQRLDFLHKLALSIVIPFDSIALESIDFRELRITDQTKTANKQKQNINRAYADVSLGLLVSLIKEKANEFQNEIILADKDYSSTQICSFCKGKTMPDYVKANHITDELRVRKWQCTVCNAELDRDINAARNLMQLTLKQVA
jgi:putative transposase